MVDFLGAKTKKNRQQSEEMKMKARERRNRGPTLMLYEREYSTKIDIYFASLSLFTGYLRVFAVFMCTCVYTQWTNVLFSIFYASFDNIH